MPWAFGLLSFRLARVRQMVTRYDWINERAGLLVATARATRPRRFQSG